MKVLTFSIQWIKVNSVMLLNAGSLVATTGVTSVLGFAYWWLAARRFSPEAVGIASTSTSAMMLISGLCSLGFSTLLLTELPRKPDLTGPLISTALVTVGVVTGVVSLVFAFIAPYISPQYRPLSTNTIDVVILVTGVTLATMTLVFDQAMIGLLRGELQLWRNTFFSLVKLLGLFIVSIWFSHQDGMGIFATWSFGSLLSLFVILGYAAYKSVLPIKKLTPQLGLLKKLGLPAFQHHLLNTMLQVPMQILPLIVTALLTAKTTAWFFTAWQLANFVFLIPSALTTVLHAMNSAQPSVLARKARSTLGLATLIAVLVGAVLIFEPQLVLSPFGASYASHAAWTLRILSFAAFPLIIKSHYISICRIYDRITSALYSMIPGSILEIVAAVAGAHFGGLLGLSIGWVVAVSIESVFMFSTVYKALWPSKKELAALPVYTAMDEQAAWLMDTIIMPAMSGFAQLGQGSSTLEAIWSTETVTMPAITDMVKEAIWNIETVTMPAITNRGGKSVAEPIHQGTEKHTINSSSAREELKGGNRHIRPQLSIPAFMAPSSATQQAKLQRYKLIEESHALDPDRRFNNTPTTDPVLQSQRSRKNAVSADRDLQYQKEDEVTELDQIDTIKVQRGTRYNKFTMNNVSSPLE